MGQNLVGRRVRVGGEFRKKIGKNKPQGARYILGKGKEEPKHTKRGGKRGEFEEGCFF